MHRSQDLAAGPRRPASRHIALMLVPLCFALLAAGCASPSKPDPMQMDLQGALDTLSKEHRVCSAAVAVIKDRKLAAVHSAANCPQARAQDAQENSVYQAASLSKPVFAYAVLKLAAQGRMALDAPVMNYLPQGYRHQFDPSGGQPSAMVTDPRLGAVTVRMLLNHTSGLPNWAWGPLRFDAPPGTEWRYSGEGYVLLQRAVEAVTGEPLDQYMQAHVFRPLDMRRSSYVWNEDIARDLQPGTKANGAPRRTIALEAANAAFSLYTSASDYGNFLAGLLSDREVTGQLTASPVPVDSDLGLSWGLGWGAAQTPGDSYIWQWGNNTGYRAFVMASPRKGDGFVLLTNSENGQALAEPLAQRILPDAHKVFQSSILQGGVLNLLCTTLRICL